MKYISTLMLSLCSFAAIAQTGIPNPKPTNSQFFTNSADTSQVWLYTGAPYKAKRLLTYGSIVGGVSKVFGRSGSVVALAGDYSAFYKSYTYVPDWNEITNKPPIYSFTGMASQFAKGNGGYATIQPSDVPTLNQNTTGSAAKLNGEYASFYTDIVGRLGYTPYDSRNPRGYIDSNYMGFDTRYKAYGYLPSWAEING